MLDTYLWNDQTAIVLALFGEEIEDAHPDVYGWYEIKRCRELFEAAGYIVLEAYGHAWVGCPRTRDIVDVVDKVSTRG
jgi:hypothetical protein